MGFCVTSTAPKLCFDLYLMCASAPIGMVLLRVRKALAYCFTDTSGHDLALSCLTCIHEESRSYGVFPLASTAHCFTPRLVRGLHSMPSCSIFFGGRGRGSNLGPLLTSELPPVPPSCMLPSDSRQVMLVIWFHFPSFSKKPTHGGRMSPAEIGWNIATPQPKCCIFFAYLTPRISPRDAMVVATEVAGTETFVYASCWKEVQDC